ncbi:hypothetical protein SASPL_114224 [Salvia splendens]|uniref:Myb/SANT-like domain-containing protein n=1 Tax=Salvia splendens TaxID=180675 RepID=A0A8X9A100_SALSN|nr:hypothetical protein SASPL_114224 [Salvia splendens]
MDIENTRAEGLGQQATFDEAFVDGVYKELAEEFTEWQEQGDIIERITFLWKRYDTFSFVINFDGTVWLSAEEYVKAKDVIWEQMIRVNEFVIAYYLQDETEYGNLSRILGPPNAPVDDDFGEVVGPSSPDDE